MSEHDQVEVDTVDFVIVRHRLFAHLFWVQSGIDENVEAADLNEVRVGANAALTVEIDKFHSIEAVRRKELGVRSCADVIPHLVASCKISSSRLPLESSFRLLEYGRIWALP